MKLLEKITLRGAVLSSVLAFAIVFGLWTCNTEDVNFDVPYITVSENMIKVGTEAGEHTVTITSNRPWRIVGNTDWCSPSRMSGEGSATITIEWFKNTYLPREATLRFATTSIAADMRLSQEGAIGVEVLYEENFGSPEENTDVSAYKGWQRGGIGGLTADYAGTATSIRSSVASNPNHYPGASSGGNVYFAMGTSVFTVTGITMLSEVKEAFLTFGASKVRYDEALRANVWVPFAANDLSLSYSTDNGVSWTPATWTMETTPVDGSTVNWALAGVTIPVNGANTLCLKFEAGIATSIRIDDLKLVSAGFTAPSLNLSRYSWNPSEAVNSTTVRVISNASSWTVTPDAAATTWCTLGGTLTGANNGNFTVNVAENPGTVRSAIITVTSGTMTKSLTVTQAESEGNVIWYEHCGTVNASASVTIGEYTAWGKKGTGAGSVTYEGTNTSVRYAVSLISQGYPNASGGNNVFFGGTPSAFIAKNIAISNLNTVTLTFGGHKFDDPYNPAQMLLYYSSDLGATWIPISYTVGALNSRWQLCTAVIPVTGITSLSLKWECTFASQYRIDDMKLVPGGAPASYLNVFPSSLTFDSAAESKSFTVSSDVAWTVSSSAYWCTVSPLFGINDGAVTVTVTPNTSSTPRSATVMVSGFGVADKTVTVTQDGVEMPTDLNTPVVWDLTVFTAEETISSLQSADGSTSRLTVTNGSGEFTTNPNTGGYVVTSSWAVGNAWVMTIPITSFTGGDIKVSYRTQSSNTGPRNWIVEWSANGTVWTSATDGAYALVNGATATPYDIVKIMTVSGITNRLFIRTRVTDDVAANPNNTTTIAGGGTNRFTGTITVEKYSASAPTLSVSPSTLSFIADGENKTFNITSSNTNWSVNSSATWCTVNPTAGSGNGTITVTASANTATTSRSATITVSGTGGVASQTISVTQAAAVIETPTDLNTPVIWDLTTFSGTATMPSLQSADGSTSRLTTTANGGTFSATSATGGYVHTNNWAVGNAWIMTIPTTSFTGGSISVSFNTQSSNTGPRNWMVEWSNDGTNWTNAIDGSYALINNGGSAGTAVVSYNIEKIMVVSGITNKLFIRTRTTDNVGANSNNTTTVAATGTNRFTGTIKVEKYIPAAPTLSVSPSTLSFIAGGENKTFNITSSNTNWSVNSSATWCTVNTSAGTGNGTITVTAAANTATTSRSATITVSGTGGVANQTVTVTQEAATPAPTLSVSPSTLSFIAGGENKTFNITSSNTNWSVNSSVTWCSVNTAAGTGNGTITVTAAANTATTSRSATITVSGTGGVANQTVTVTQEAATPAPTLSVSPSALSFIADGENKTFNITSSNTNWSVNSSATWCSVNTAAGTGNATVTVTASANTATTSRSATITVSGTGGVANQAVTVTQAAATPSGPVPKAIADVRVLKTHVPTHGNTYTITDDWSITGRVVSDRVGANLNARNFVLTDGTAANSGIQVRLPANHAFNMGDEVTVSLQGGTLANYYNLLQLEVASDKAVNTGAATITPTSVLITETQLKAGNFESMYVRIVNTQVINAQLSGTMQGSITMEVNGGGTYTMFTNSTAIFRTDPRPQGSGTLSGIAAVYNADYQVQPRNAADFAALTEPRFGAPPPMTLAKWDITTLTEGTLSAATATPAKVPATTGSGTLTITPNTGTLAVVGPTYLNVTGSTTTIRWGLDKAWLMEIPVTSFTGGNVLVTFNAQSSGTGPRDFAVEWSADGINYSIATPAEEYTLSASNALKNITITPSGITTTLYIRLRVRSDTNVNGTTPIGNGGTSRITTSLTVATL